MHLRKLQLGLRTCCCRKSGVVDKVSKRLSIDGGNNQQMATKIEEKEIALAKRALCSDGRKQNLATYLSVSNRSNTFLVVVSQRLTDFNECFLPFRMVSDDSGVDKTAKI